MDLRLHLAKLWNHAVRVKPKMRGKYNVLLDLGCGMGHYCKILRKHAEYIIGMDVYLPSLKQAKKTEGFDDLILADIRNPPIQKDKIDLCLTNRPNIVLPLSKKPFYIVQSDSSAHTKSKIQI